MIFSKCKADHVKPCFHLVDASLLSMGWSPNFLASPLNKSSQGVALHWGLWLWLCFLASSSLVSWHDLWVPGGARLFHASLPAIQLLSCWDWHSPLRTLRLSTTTSVMLSWVACQSLGGIGHSLLCAHTLALPHFSYLCITFLLSAVFVTGLEIVLPG